MKWEKRGHQFDKIGEYYKKTKKIYFYGAVPVAEPIIEQLEYAVKSINNGILDFEIEFVDRDDLKRKNPYLERMVIEPDLFYSRFHQENALVVLCMSEGKAKEVWEQLNANGIFRGEQAYTPYEFYRYLSLFIYYRYQKFYLHFLDLFLHTNCNLNCRHCCIHTYRGVKKYRPIDQIIENIDELFSKVDIIGIMNFGIAEGFLGGDNLEKALSYILDNYSSHFRDIEIVTNGTIVPNDSLLKVLQNQKVRVVVDDYTDNVKQARDSFSKVMDCLEKSNVRHIGLKRAYWEEYEFGNVTDFNTDALGKKYKNCICHAKGFAYLGYGEKSTKVYSCVHQTINAYHGIVEEVDDDGVDILDDDPLVIIEFLLGYSEKGYLSACTQCNGAFEWAEATRIPVAVQIESKNKWS